MLETFDGRTNSQRLLERTADAKPIIDKFDKIFGQMKNWFITSLIALTGVSVVKDQPKFLFLNVVLVIAFYVAEVGYRLAHDAFLARTRKIEAILRSECEFTTEHMPPPSTNIYFMDARNGSSFLDRVKDAGAIESLRALLVRSIGNRILFSAPCSVDESQPCEFAVWPASGYNPIPPAINPGVMPYRALLASALLLAACTTTQGVTDRLGERYTGRHIDQFFLSYGSPISEYALSNGDKFYTWRSDVNSVTLPGSSNFSGSVNNYGQIQGSSIHRPPITIPIICEIHFLARSYGMVKRIEITRDTRRMLRKSRCAELLNSD